MAIDLSLTGLLIIAAQILFTVHVVNTGKDRLWILIIIFVPLIGCLVYFFTQILPTLGQSTELRKVGKSFLQTIDPKHQIRQRQEALEISDNIDNRLQLGDAYLEAGRFSEALALYKGCLQGLHEDDPHIMLKLAQAHFHLQNHTEAKITLDLLRAKNFPSQTGHLLYARTLEAMGLITEAITEYEILAESWPGEEARVRFGLLLQQQGKTEAAAEIFKAILTRAKRAPQYYRNKEKQWIKIAKEHA